jgi:uncharacterized protein (DUF924 family)
LSRAPAPASGAAGLAGPGAGRAGPRDWDLTIDPPARQFFYMPFEHSESLPDQEHSVRLMKERMPASPELLLHARAHREVIRKFGRFPYRNAHLGRSSTAAETAYVEAGGYRVTLAALKVA